MKLAKETRPHSEREALEMVSELEAEGYEAATLMHERGVFVAAVMSRSSDESAVTIEWEAA